MKQEFKYFINSDLIAKHTIFSPIHESVVVFIPGYFSATSIGPNRLFVEIEEALCGKCRCTYRLDWPGMGDNKGILANYSFQDLSDQLMNLCVFLNSEYNLENVNFIAHSMGCAILANALSKSDFQANRLILLSPVSFSENKYNTLIGKIDVTDNKYTRKGVFFHKDFIRSPCDNLIYKSIGLNAKEVITITCDDDPFVLQEDLHLVINKAKSYKNFRLPVGGHNFLTYAAKNKSIKLIKSMEW